MDAGPESSLCAFDWRACLRSIWLSVNSKLFSLESGEAYPIVFVIDRRPPHAAAGRLTPHRWQDDHIYGTFSFRHRGSCAVPHTHVDPGSGARVSLGRSSSGGGAPAREPAQHSPLLAARHGARRVPRAPHR
eukprot:2952109-Prymnesium_polylepis.1